MRLLIFFLALTFIITTYSKRPGRPWKPWSKPSSTGRKCSKKVTNLCNWPKKCKNDGCKYKCKNMNKQEPNGKTKKGKYCKKVRCVKPECSCPMYHEPVCDSKGNYHDNIECAKCNTCKPKEEFSFSHCNLGVGVIGPEGPQF